MFKINGLDKLAQKMKELQEAMQLLDGELGVISFNPDDPGDIERAILSGESLIDERLASFYSNSSVASIASQLKEKIRENILQRAASHRLGEGG